MKNILVINDNTPEARHAAEFALAIAQKTQAGIILANNFVKSHKSIQLATSGDMGKIVLEEQFVTGLIEHLRLLNDNDADFKPEIEEFDMSNMDEGKLAEVINRNQTWMIVKGMPDVLPQADPENQINIHSVLNKVLCPLFLIPLGWQQKDLERLVYIADLRYCRIEIARYVAALAKPWNADVSIAHMSANGLPDIEERYALSIFSEQVCNNVNYDRLFFNNIKEKDLSKAVDVLINGMHNDVLVMVNHRFHFKTILGRYITDALPAHLTVPVLVFPY